MYALPDIEHLMPKSIAEALKQNTRYDDTLADAVAYVNESTGLELDIISDVTACPWLRIPFAWIVKKLASGFIANPSPELLTQLDGDFKKALEILKEHKISDKRTSKQAFIGDIYDAYTDEVYP